jgi:YMGG-like Gly-zipper
MIRFSMTLPLIPLFLAACTPAEQNAAIGAIGGAAVGAAVSADSDRAKGALVGAAVGLAASQLLGPASTPGQCRYIDQYGNEYVAACQ